MSGSSQPIGKLLEGWLAQTHKQQSALFEVQQAWSKIAGRTISAHTKPGRVRKARLTVHVDRPGENFLLSYERERVLERIKKLTQGKITEMVVRAGKI